MDMISLHNIQKSYGSHQVLKNVDLTVRQGEIYGLIGKNGAGKTAILKIVLGLTDFENGRLSIAGKSAKADLGSGRKKIGFFIGKNFFRLSDRQGKSGILPPDEGHSGQGRNRARSEAGGFG